MPAPSPVELALGALAAVGKERHDEMLRRMQHIDGKLDALAANLSPVSDEARARALARQQVEVEREEGVSEIGKATVMITSRLNAWGEKLSIRMVVVAFVVFIAGGVGLRVLLLPNDAIIGLFHSMIELADHAVKQPAGAAVK